MEYFYKPLLTVSVEHGYFADGLWHGLNFVPLEETARLMERNGLLVRQAGNGIAVFYDELMQERLLHDGELLPLRFNVYVQDRTYATYTSPTLRREDTVPVFGNRRGDGPLLTAGEFAGDADFRPVDELVALGLLDRRDFRGAPDFMVGIETVVGEDAVSVPAYRIRFEARSSYWKYHLLGNMNREGLYIVDLDNRIEFEPRGEAMLPGNRRSRVFMSTQRVPVLEQSNYRFQLREQGTGREKILIKRLPAASELRLGQGLIDGRKEIVLENYVNY